jgi:4-hydroxybenzoate polyprenyltransferase
MPKSFNAGNIFLGVFAVATIRDLLEVTLQGAFLLSHEEPISSLRNYFLHFNSFYFLVFIALSLVLFFFTSKRATISDCLKTGALAMTLIWVGPVFDYFISGSFDMFYPRDPWDVVCHLYRIADPTYVFEGMSRGMRLEILLAGTGAAVFLYYKTKKIVKSICGGICISVTCLFIGLLIPFITQLYEYGFNFGYHKLSDSTLLHQGFVVHDASSKIALLYIFLCILLFAWAYYLRSRQRFFSLMKNFRWTRSLHYLLLFAAGVAYIYHNPPIPDSSYASYFEYLTTIWNHPFDLFAIFMGALAFFLSFQSAVIFNDIYDYDIDVISNRNRPLVAKSMSKSEYVLIGRLFVVLSLSIALCLSEAFFLLVLLFHLMSFLYSAPPFRLRKFFLASNILLATIFLLTLHAGTVVLISDYRFENIPSYITFGLILSFALALSVKDYKDMEGDRQAHVQTLYTLLGQKNGNRATVFLVCCSILFTSVLLKLSQMYAFSVVACILFLTVVILVRNQKIKEGLVVSLYFLYVVSLFYFLIFPSSIHGHTL